MPKTLREAVGRLDRSEVLREALGDEVVDHYVHAAPLGAVRLRPAVTDWELVRGFERA